MTGNGQDTIDRAIEPPERSFATFNFRFKSGLEARLLIDAAADKDELLELIGVIGGQVPGKLDEFRTPASRLTIVRGAIPRT